MLRKNPRLPAVILLFVAAPLLMGGCPEFQNQAVDAFETAIRTVVDSAVSLFFDQFRSN